LINDEEVVVACELVDGDHNRNFYELLHCMSPINTTHELFLNEVGLFLTIAEEQYNYDIIDLEYSLSDVLHEMVDRFW
jgi:hypothetical protein